MVTVDRAGRILLPKDIRGKRKISAGTKLIVVEAPDGRILLRKFDSEEFWKRLDQEMQGVDVDAIAKRVREEIDAKIRKKYPKVFGRH